MVVSAFVQSLHALLLKFGIQAPDIRVHGLTLDSRVVNAKLAFVAVKGYAFDGRDFIEQAVELGARAVIAQANSVEEHGRISVQNQTTIIKFWELPALLSSLAAAFYDYPASKLATVAVTGTNGKTSVVQLVTQLKHALGNRTASIGTLGSGIFSESCNHEPATNGNTTPDAISMQYLLAEFVQQEVHQVAYEASSHALVQNRLKQVNTDIAVFTNLSRDHLDYHLTMEAYSDAKMRLLDLPGLHTVVLNYDDPVSQHWASRAAQSIATVWTSVRHNAEPNMPQGRYCFATNVNYDQSGCQFTLTSSWGESAVKVNLLGHFNLSNLLNAAAVLLCQGERFARVVQVMTQAQPVAGRLEMFAMANCANVVVDYAHTPDALEQALLAMRQHTIGALWCVFGCGGDRDKGKRALMGQAAEQFADHRIITTDNSRSEDPEQIVSAIRTGMSKPELAIDIPDREQAIRYCLEHAAENDLILVAGKGHETYQIIGEQKTNYNERAVVARLQRECSK